MKGENSVQWDDNGMKKNLITILIPTYNRKKELKRALDSLEKQTVKEFECIVVDDGSTDGTKDTIHFSDYSFKINYYYQENKGVLWARYYGLCHVKSELTILLDSDDELVDTAVERILLLWTKIPIIQKECYCGIMGLYVSGETGIRLGKMLPENYNYKFEGGSRIKYIKKCFDADRLVAYVTQHIITQYKDYQTLMEQAGSNFVPEGMLYLKYALEGKRYYCVNEILGIVHETAVSLTRGVLTKEKCKISYWTYSYYINNYVHKYKLPLAFCGSCYMYMMKFGLLLGKKMWEMYNDIPKFSDKILLTLWLPFGVGNYIFGKHIEE